MVHFLRKQPQVHSINSIGKIPSILFGGFEFPLPTIKKKYDILIIRDVHIPVNGPYRRYRMTPSRQPSLQVCRIRNTKRSGNTDKPLGACDDLFNTLQCPGTVFIFDSDPNQNVFICSDRKYELLNVLEFSSSWKWMCLLVKEPEGRICKYSTYFKFLYLFTNNYRTCALPMPAYSASPCVPAVKEFEEETGSLFYPCVPARR